jgi:hypothetical protein
VTVRICISSVFASSRLKNGRFDLSSKCSEVPFDYVLVIKVFFRGPGHDPRKQQRFVGRKGEEGTEVQEDYPCCAKVWAVSHHQNASLFDILFYGGEDSN